MKYLCLIILCIFLSGCQGTTIFTIEFYESKNCVSSELIDDEKLPSEIKNVLKNCKYGQVKNIKYYKKQGASDFSPNKHFELSVSGIEF